MLDHVHPAQKQAALHPPRLGVTMCPEHPSELQRDFVLLPIHTLQGPEHPNPGKSFTARGFPRHCYLPDSEKGRKVKGNQGCLSQPEHTQGCIEGEREQAATWSMGKCRYSLCRQIWVEVFPTAPHHALQESSDVPMYWGSSAAWSTIPVGVGPCAVIPNFLEGLAVGCLCCRGILG